MKTQKIKSNKQSDPQELSAAIIRAYRKDLSTCMKKAESDEALIASLNRYIEALEGKIKMAIEKNHELLERIETLMAAYLNADQIKQ